MNVGADFTAVIAISAMFATLWQGILLRRQVRHGENLSRSQLYQQIAQQFIRLDEFFVDHPDLRPYFYADKLPPTDGPGRERVLATAELIADVAESCVATDDVLGATQAGGWDKYFRYVYNLSPALRQYWQELGHLYPDDVWRCFAVEPNLHSGQVRAVSDRRASGKTSSRAS